MNDTARFRQPEMIHVPLSTRWRGRHDSYSAMLPPMGEFAIDRP